jgi:hypothetical protein
VSCDFSRRKNGARCKFFCRAAEKLFAHESIVTAKSEPTGSKTFSGPKLFSGVELFTFHQR